MTIGSRKIALILILFIIAGTIGYFESQRPKLMNAQDSAIDSIRMNTSKEAMYETAKEISSPDAFINTPAITISELIGKKIILVDFWTYSCINCQRTTPYLNAWYEKYRD